MQWITEVLRIYTETNQHSKDQHWIELQCTVLLGNPESWPSTHHPNQTKDLHKDLKLPNCPPDSECLIHGDWTLGDVLWWLAPGNTGSFESCGLQEGASMDRTSCSCWLCIIWKLLTDVKLFDWVNQTFVLLVAPGEKWGYCESQ